jgi:DNA replication and repair protein RecF
VAHLAGSSLRGATTEAMVRVGAERAVIRAEATRGPRELLLEAELAVRGRSRMQLNRQPVKRRRDLLDALAVTVFSPDDLVLVKGGPGERRRWLDEAAAGLDHQTETVRSDVERILKQRNALLKQSRGRMDEAALLTLDVWDDRLSRAGEALAERRTQALEQLVPRITEAYRDLAGLALPVGATYEASWRGTGLAAALAEAREQDLRRGITTVGPHRDEIALSLDGLPARTHASQGEQRSLALALRLSVHRAITEASGASPVLLLDDVLSELDGDRTEALLAHLPPGQTLLTTAGPLPRQTRPALVLRVADGTVGPGSVP